MDVLTTFGSICLSEGDALSLTFFTAVQIENVHLRMG